MKNKIINLLFYILLFNESYAWFRSTNKCLYKKDPLANLQRELDNRLICQEFAKEYIYNEISRWYVDRKGYNQYLFLNYSPLVLSFSGATRTGKTLASIIIENSFLYNYENYFLVKETLLLLCHFRINYILYIEIEWLLCMLLLKMLENMLLIE